MGKSNASQYANFGSLHLMIDKINNDSHKLKSFILNLVSA